MALGNSKILSWFGTPGGLALLACLVSPGLAFGTAAQAGAVPGQPAAPAAVSPSTAGGDLYASEPVPMEPAECARCHTHQYQNLKAAGGRHRFDCRDCHEVFHAYNPRKNNFAELMPKCANCHSLPHGDRQTDCLGCHENPHAVRRAPSLAKLENKCPDCHQGPSDQLKTAPSAHTELGCATCHSDRHGFIPECFACHEPHFTGQTVKACMGCHPPHRPRDIQFSAESAAETCQACHQEVYIRWSKSPSRHHDLNCTVCHSRHGFVPDCLDCHKPPHEAAMLARFPNCLGCHLDPHALPVKRSR